MLAPKKKPREGPNQGGNFKEPQTAQRACLSIAAPQQSQSFPPRCLACAVPPQGQDDGLKHSRSPITTTNKPPIGKNRLQELPGRVWAIAVRKTLAVQFR